MSSTPASRRSRRARFALAGLCLHCGKRDPRDGTKYCPRCLNLWASYRERERNKKQDRSPDGATWDEIAAVMGVSRERVRQICRRALVKLRHACKKYGIDESDIVGKKGFSMIATAEKWA